MQRKLLLEEFDVLHSHLPCAEEGCPPLKSIVSPLTQQLRRMSEIETKLLIWTVQYSWWKEELCCFVDSAGCARFE